MNLDRQAFRVMEAAIELPENRQESFLVEACDGDSRLLRKVQSLMGAVEDESDFLATRGGSEKHQPTPFRERVGEYRILREIGRGGMGVVYEAEQDSMKRRVALKILSAGSAPSESQLARFYREARAAGQLHHTNIVPVFEVGSSDGLHFYAMQYIEGANLDRLIDEVREIRQGKQNDDDGLVRSVAERFCGIKTSQAGSRASKSQSKTGQRRQSSKGQGEIALRTDENRNSADSSEARHPNTKSSNDTSGSIFVSAEWTSTNNPKTAYFRRVAAIGLQVADALEYAHRSGVLHRDIKPANLILDKNGTVWVLDFGLAKTGNDGLTVTGDVIGTLRYMAPERLNGENDLRSEIYSLGLTLYELATLQYAFDAKDRSSLLKQVTSEAPRPPRTIDAQVPRDLETIILKAIDRSPSGRYPSAKEMADDLRRYLLDHPITARRISPMERAWRLCRRNPVVTSLAALLVGLLIFIAVGSARFAYVSHQKTVQAELAEKSTRQRRYELNLQTSRAIRNTKQLGRRFEALSAIEAAAGLLPTLEFSKAEREQERCRLRSEAASAMGLFDMRPLQRWDTDDALRETFAFDSDFERFAQGSFDHGEIVIKSVSSAKQGKPLARISTAFRSTFGMTFSNDGKYLFSQNITPGVNLNIWALRGPQENLETPLISLKSHHFGRCEFSYDSSFVVFGLKNSLAIYDLSTGAKTGDVPLDFAPKEIRISRDGQQLAVASSKSRTIEIWNLAPTIERDRVLTLPDDVQSIRSFDWSLDRNLLVAGLYNGDLLVWKDGLDEAPQRHLLHRHTVVKLRLHPTEPIVFTASWDGTVRVFDLVTNQAMCRLENYQIQSTGLNRDGTRLVLTSTEDSSFGVWEVSTPSVRRFRYDLSNLDATRVYRSAHVHPVHPRLVLTAHEQAIKLRDAQGAKTLHRISDVTSAFAQFSKDGRSILVFSKAGCYQIPLQVTEDSADIHVTVRPAVALTKALPRGDRFFVADDEQSVVVVFNENAGGAHAERIPFFGSDAEPVRYGPHAGMSSATISPDGKWVATGTWKSRGVKVWNAATGELATDLMQQATDNFCEFSADSQALFIAKNEALVAIKVADWRPLPVSAPRKQGIMGDIDFSGNAPLMVANYSRYHPQLIDPSSGRCLLRLENENEDTLRSYSLTNSASHLAIGCTDYAYVWDLAQLRQQLSEIGLGW